MRVRGYLLLGLGASLLGCVLAVMLVPPLDDLWVENPYWNGLSEVYGELKPGRVRELSETLYIDAENSTLFMIGPSSEFTAGDVETVRVFLEGGGKVVLADDFGSGNQLLEGLGLSSRFTGMLLLDSVFNDLNPRFPRLLNFTVFNVKSREVVLNYATTLKVDGEGVVVESSSPFSYVGEEEKTLGPFTVMARIRFGRGLLVLLSDPSIFINSMMAKAGNQDLLRMIVRGRPYIDEAHSIPTLLTQLKLYLAEAYNMLTVAEVRYSLSILGVVAILGLGVKNEQVLNGGREPEKKLSRR